MATLKLRAIGNSVGVVLPKEVLSRLNVAEGDSLYAVPDGDGVRLVTTDPQFERDMQDVREIMKRRRAVLRELAK